MNAEECTIAGAPFRPKAVIKQMSPNKFSMEINVAEGMGTLMKQSFDGEAGYVEQQGRKIPMDDADSFYEKIVKRII